MINAVTAAEVAVLLGFSPQLVAQALTEVPQVPGRFELIESSNGQIQVVVDYAHTPEGIKSVLKAARNVTEGRLILVFGAGGDRDQHKRPAMGRAAEKYADRIILTNDNPRSENPQKIIADITSGMKKSPDCVILKRRLAISSALKSAAPGDLVVIAGKGHENAQIIGDDEIEFDDRQVVKEELSRLYGCDVVTEGNSGSRVC